MFAIRPPTALGISFSFIIKSQFTNSLNAVQPANQMRPLVLPSIRLYAALTLFLSVLQLRHALLLAHPHATARAAVQLLTAIALLPVCIIPQTITPHAKRWPVLSAFLLTFSLIIDAVLRVLTAIEVLSSPLKPSTFHSPITLVLTNLLATFTAAFLFRSYSALPQTVLRPQPKRKSPFDTTHSPALAALYLHAITAALSHLCDIVALFAQSITVNASLDIAAAVLSITWVLPLLHYSTAVLMHATPPPFVNTIKTCREEVLALEGVQSCGNVHVWEESAGVLVGTLCVEVDGRVSKSWVLEKAVAAFEGVVDDLTIQVESWRGDQVPNEKTTNVL